MAEAKNKKSGLKKFKAGEIVFNEKDAASSLYIIQSGQLRLFRPKGKGYVELAILRSGEVIGEMAYFDKTSGRRSCSAEAIVETTVVEISFNAFEKVMNGLNPWFKTIINTLVDRLKKTNERIKGLESNSMGFSASGKSADYKFFHSTDCIRILSLLYFSFKSQGVVKDGVLHIHESKLKFNMIELFNISEIKFTEFLEMLKQDQFIEVGLDQNEKPLVLKTSTPQHFQSMMLFLNGERQIADDKKLRISPKCELLLRRIVDFFTGKISKEEKVQCDISAILEGFKNDGIPLSGDDLDDAIRAGLCDDIVIDANGKLTANIKLEKMRNLLPSIRLSNAIQRVNDKKAKAGKYTAS